METVAKHIVVHGRVQGVGFRYFVQRAGDRMALTGNVANCPDSTVEIFVQGDAKEVGRFIQEIEKGPAIARVDRIDVRDAVPRGNYSGFLIEGR